METLTSMLYLLLRYPRHILVSHLKGTLKCQINGGPHLFQSGQSICLLAFFQQEIISLNGWLSGNHGCSIILLNLHGLLLVSLLLWLVKIQITRDANKFFNSFFIILHSDLTQVIYFAMT